MPEHSVYVWPTPGGFEHAAAMSAAYSVHRKWNGLVEVDDLKQEALLYVATHREAVEKRAGNKGWLIRRIADAITTSTVMPTLRVSEREEPLEAVVYDCE